MYVDASLAGVELSKTHLSEDESYARKIRCYGFLQMSSGHGISSEREGMSGSIFMASNKKISTAAVAVRLEKKRAFWKVFLQKPLLGEILNFSGPKTELTMADAILFHRPRQWWFAHYGCFAIPPRVKAPIIRINILDGVKVRYWALDTRGRNEGVLAHIAIHTLNLSNIQLFEDGSVKFTDKIMKELIPLPSSTIPDVVIDDRDESVVRAGWKDIDSNDIIFPLTFAAIPLHPQQLAIWAKNAEAAVPEGVMTEDQLEEHNNERKIKKELFFCMAWAGDGFDFWLWKRMGFGPRHRSSSYPWPAMGINARDVPIEEAFWRAGKLDEAKQIIDGKITIDDLVEWKDEHLPALPGWYLVKKGVRELKEVTCSYKDIADAIRLGYHGEIIPFLARGDFKYTTGDEAFDWHESIERLRPKDLRLVEKYQTIKEEDITLEVLNENLQDYFILERGFSIKPIIEDSLKRRVSIEVLIRRFLEHPSPERLGLLADYSLCYGFDTTEETERKELARFIYDAMAGMEFKSDDAIKLTNIDHIFTLLREKKEDEFFSLVMDPKFPGAWKKTEEED